MSDQETATAPEAAAPAPEAATAPSEEPKPEATTAPTQQETNWEKAYKGLQTNLNRVQQTNAELRRQLSAQGGSIDTLLRQQLGEDAYKQHVQEQQFAQQQQQALEAATIAREYVPHAIAVVSETMRAAGVPEKEIENIWVSAGNAATSAEWAATVKAGTAQAIAKAKSDLEARVAEQVRAKSKDEIQAEAQALAERTVRASGIDKVDLGRGQSRTPERNFTERLRSIDRNTPEGEAEFQKLKKEAVRGTLRP